MKFWLPLITATVILASCAERRPVDPATAPVHYFEKTGHTVRGEFRYFFDQYGSLDRLGYPLTEEIVVDGWRVQYFENGRLEYHPENEPAYRVTIGWLGDLLHRRRPPISPAAIPGADDKNSTYFSETGHRVSGDFLRYFDTHGGTVTFGLPISEPFLMDGRLTQDFQSARFFWTPDRVPPVTLEEIGRVHFETSGLNRALLEATGD